MDGKNLEQGDNFSSMERVKAPLGEAADNYLGNNPEIGAVLKEEDYQNFYISNRGGERAVVHIDGIGPEYPRIFRRGRLARAIDGKGPEGLDLTLISSDWSDSALLPEFCAAQVVDLCLAEGIKEVVIYANCYGGHAALVLAKLIAQRKGENLATPGLAGLITLNSLVEGADLRVVPDLGGAGKSLSNAVAERVMAWGWKLSRGVKEINKQKFHPFTKLTEDDFRGLDFRVLSIVTRPAKTIFGRAIPDVLVDTITAREKLKGLLNGQSFSEADLPGSYFVEFKKKGVQVGLGTHEVGREYADARRKLVVAFIKSVLVSNAD